MAAKILMVCLGNICRSPLAEGILRAKLPAGSTVDSAGTSNYHIGETPDRRSVATAKKHGLDISKQRGRQVTVADFEEFDVIYAMDRSNMANLLALAPDDTARKKVKLILDELPNSPETDVPDPYYGGNDGFELVYQMLDEACETIARRYQ